MLFLKYNGRVWKTSVELGSLKKIFSPFSNLGAFESSAAPEPFELPKSGDGDFAGSPNGLGVGVPKELDVDAGVASNRLALGVPKGLLVFDC